jgi:oligopeptide/dipeptide ABC transporter ATP-binding protein
MLGKGEEARQIALFLLLSSVYWTAQVHSRIDEEKGKKSRLHVIKGMVPDMRRLPPGCTFQDRCPEVQEICKEPPALEKKSSGHLVRCWMR